MAVGAIAAADVDVVIEDVAVAADVVAVVVVGGGDSVLAASVAVGNVAVAAAVRFDYYGPLTDCTFVH